MAINFPFRVNRNTDPVDAIQKLQQLLEFLRDEIEKIVAKTMRGSSSVAAAATTVIVTHGFNQPSYSVALTPLADPGGRFWASNKTSNDFQINLQTAAPGGGVPFDWILSSA